LNFLYHIFFQEELTAFLSIVSVIFRIQVKKILPAILIKFVLEY